MDRIDELFDLLEGKNDGPKLRPAIIFLDDTDKIRKQTTYQLWNQIVDYFDGLERKNKKQRYSAEDVRKKVKFICTRLITSQNTVI